MAKPTLTPKQQTSVIVLSENYPVPAYDADPESDYQKLITSFPFGCYSSSFAVFVFLSE